MKISIQGDSISTTYSYFIGKHQFKALWILGNSQKFSAYVKSLQLLILVNSLKTLKLPL